MPLPFRFVSTSNFGLMSSCFLFEADFCLGNIRPSTLAAVMVERFVRELGDPIAIGDPLLAGDILLDVA